MHLHDFDFVGNSALYTFLVHVAETATFEALAAKILHEMVVGFFVGNASRV